MTIAAFKSAVLTLFKALPLAALGFIVYRFIKMDVDWSLITSSSKIWGAGTVVILLYLVSVFITAAFFTFTLMKISGAKVPFREIISVYITSNLFKYLPGNVLHYVGRNSLGAAHGIPHKDIAFTSLFEAMGNVLFVGLASILIGFPFFRQLASAAFGENHFWVIGGVFICFIGIITLIILFHISNRFRGLVVRLFSKETKQIWFIGIVVFCFNYIVNGFSYYLILTTLINTGAEIAFLSVLAIYNLAWLAGFVTPGAPGGIGIKEFVLILFLGSMVGNSVLMISVVLHRMMLILTDVLAYFGRQLFLRH